jgi:TctA family transporter
VTCIDGHQMARQGRAGPALATAALASVFAGCVATAMIALLAPAMTRVALSFGPEAYFSLMVLGLVAAIVLAQGAFLKALAMVLLGLLLGLVGTDTTTGDTRMTMGLLEFSDGIPFVCLAVGVFGIAEIVTNLRDPEPRRLVERRVRNLWITRDDFARAWKPAVRGTAIGGFFGALPGGGAVLSAFAAYSLEKKLARDPSRFGKGAIEGVAAPEAANNAGAQASFVPLLTLGIPANAVMAVMIGAMQIQGIAPGPRIIETQSLVFWSLIASMWIGNLMLVVINLPLIGIWVRLLTVPYRLLYPSIIVFACIGVYSMNNNPMDVVLTVVFGAMGVLMRRYGFEPAPLILGFVLGPLMETNFRRAMLLSRGDASVFVTDALSAGFLAATVAVLLLLAAPAFRRTRTQLTED